MIARRLSALFTLACGAVLLGFIGLVASLHLAEPTVEAVAEPERALALIVERTMELSDALARAPAWERRFYELTMMEGSGERAQAIEWYHELAHHSLDPGVDLRLALLEAESGHTDDLRQSLEAWRRRGPPFDVYGTLVAAAYLDGPLPAVGPALRAQADHVPAGWFRARLAERLATRAADGEWLQALGAAADARTSDVLARVRVLTVIELALLIGGVLGAVLWVKRDRTRRRVADGVVPPPWALREGLVVLVRGGAVGAVLVLLLLYAVPWPDDSAALEILAIPVMNLPLLVLAQRRLTPSPVPGLGVVLGLRPSRAGWGALAMTAGILTAAGVVIDLGIAVAGEALGLGTHWTEWFDSDMAWGAPAMVAAGVVSAVVFAPVFEEIVFRGLLFGTLRRGMGWPLAAALSAAVFAVAHGYGALGFASVFVSGFLWAWAYDKTGSLWPGMMAHAVNNVFASIALLWLVRS